MDGSDGGEDRKGSGEENIRRGRAGVGRTYVNLLRTKAEFFEPKPTQLQMACSI